MTDLRTDSERHADEQAALARQQIGRRGFIGGSDVAAILGISPWGSPWSVWAEKTGLVEPSHSDEHTERMEIGKDAERFLADVFNRHHAGMRVGCRQLELDNERWPWLRGHADGAVVVPSEDGVLPVGGWEAKTTGDFAPWAEIPAMYQAQAQVYMMLSGLESWWFTVGFAGWKVKHYVVDADADDQALIAEATERFWNDHVLAGVPPEVDGSDATTTAIRSAYGNATDPDDTVYADEELLAVVDSLRVVRADLKALEQTEAELSNRLKARLADAAVLQYGDQVLATWKPSTTHRLDTHALKADHPDLVEKYMAESVTRRFLVKPSRGE